MRANQRVRVQPIRREPHARPQRSLVVHFDHGIVGVRKQRHHGLGHAGHGGEARGRRVRGSLPGASAQRLVGPLRPRHGLVLFPRGRLRQSGHGRPELRSPRYERVRTDDSASPARSGRRIGQRQRCCGGYGSERLVLGRLSRWSAGDAIDRFVRQPDVAHHGPAQCDARRALRV